MKVCCACEVRAGRASQPPAVPARSAPIPFDFSSNSLRIIRGFPLNFFNFSVVSLLFLLDSKGDSLRMLKFLLDSKGITPRFQRGYPSISFRFPFDFKGNALQLPLVGARTSYRGADPPSSACSSQAHHNFIRNMVRTSQAPPEAETPLQLILHTHNIYD